MTMLAAPLDLSNLGTAVGSTTATKAATGANSAEAAQDRFLKLLVAQLNNQDPLNPMDNAQMTTQMTQISTVSGIEQLNSTLKGMAAQYTAMQTLQGTSLIGRDALVAGSGLHFQDGSAQGAVSLGTAAGSVQVDIIGTSGAVIDTLDLGALGPGQHAFQWEAGSTDPASVRGFSIRATQNGSPVTATPLTRVPVSAVSFQDGAMTLQLGNGQRLGYDQVEAFM